ncbi:MAG: hypothetical protein AUH20_04735 [Candidatus Rokubacteria bacterium 13_2_20CM_69_15_2]|nr:MAG: hypothetical protein AUH20_04735 [Candidatus Rokubacteria bacterium 13_2_20CM_69_15_2]PYO20187.1 MAG: hypothetical protein DMD88_12825 [Candidatus Rokubacteria bacterium]
MDLNDRVAVVTGASGEIGARIAYRLAAAGADVVVTYVDNHEGALVTCRSVESLGRRTAAIRLDQTDPSSVAAAIEAAAGQWSRLDILVNNAAWNIGIPFADLDALTPAIWDRIYATNARGPFLLARAAAPHLRQQGAGRIVNIASVAGLSPGGSSIAYATSKAALVHLTRCLAVALAPRITVNCVAPGLVEGTRMAQRLTPEMAAAARQQAVLQRTTSADDVSNQVVAFCRADTVTGQVLTIDAGIHFH